MRTLARARLSAAVHSRPAAAGRTRRAAATPAALPPARGHAAAAAEALSTSLELLYGAPAFEDDDASLSTTDTPLDGLSNAEAGLAAWEAVQACVAKHVADAGPAGLPVVALSGDAGGAVVAAALASVADESSAAAFVSGLAECETESSADRERARYTADLLGLELFEVESPLACDLVADPACRARAALNAVVAAASAAAGRSGSVVFCGASSPAAVAAAEAAGAVSPLAGLPKAVIASAARAAGVPDWAECAGGGGGGGPAGMTLVDAPGAAGGRVLAAAGGGARP